MISREGLPDTPDWELPREQPKVYTLPSTIELGEN